MKTSKEILRIALNHSEGPVPLDFGATAVTGIHCSVVEDLRRHFGLEERLVKINEPYQMLGLIEDDLAEAMGVDVVGIAPRKTHFGFLNEGWKEWRTPWGQEVLVPELFNVTYEGEDIFIYPEGDLSIPPSGRMSKSAFFFDAIIRQEPLVEEDLNPEDNLEEFTEITDEELEYFKDECNKASKTERGVVANFGGTAFGDIGLVPAPFLKAPKGIRDIAEWYISTVTRQDYIHKVFSQQAEIAVRNLAKVYEVVGNIPDVVFVCGTDFGTQTSQFCSKETFTTLYAPYYRKVNDWIHKNTDWRTFKHSCGAVEPFMDDFIEVGFDIINPVQCSATGMDPGHLKSTYGDRLTFWGGGVDTQKTLPFGDSAEVSVEVLERCRVFSTNGGFIFNAIHNIQAKTPLTNIVDLIETVRSYNEGR